MSTTTRDPAIDGLGPFAELPDWLAAPMRPGRLETSLREHVPELRDGRLTLLECRADRLRAKDARWLARCRAIVTPAAAGGLVEHQQRTHERAGTELLQRHGWEIVGPNPL